MEKFLITTGRILLGLYFLYPGITKIPRYDFMLEYMALHNVPLVNILLPITIVAAPGAGKLTSIRPVDVKELGPTEAMRTRAVPGMRIESLVMVTGSDSS